MIHTKPKGSAKPKRNTNNGRTKPCVHSRLLAVGRRCTVLVVGRPRQAPMEREKTAARHEEVKS
jgi:hypothetical protein